MICQGATRKKTKRELESKVRQQMSAMKVLQSEKEAASRKLVVLGQKYKKVSASLQSARASVQEVNSKKRKVEASLNHLLKMVRLTLQKHRKRAQQQSIAWRNKMMTSCHSTTLLTNVTQKGRK